VGHSSVKKLKIKIKLNEEIRLEMLRREECKSKQPDVDRFAKKKLKKKWKILFKSLKIKLKIRRL